MGGLADARPTAFPARRSGRKPPPPPRSEPAACTARLEDGRQVAIRQAGDDDLAGIVDFFERLSDDARYMRFFSPQPRMRRAMVEQIVAPGPDRVSVIAQPIEFRATGRHVIAVGGWAYDAPADRCDVSIAVADAWQNQMLGTYVTLVVLRAAVAAGRHRFSAEVLSPNARMLGLLGTLGAPLRTRQEAGVVHVAFELPGEVAA